MQKREGRWRHWQGRTWSVWRRESCWGEEAEPPSPSLVLHHSHIYISMLRFLHPHLLLSSSKKGCFFAMVRSWRCTKGCIIFSPWFSLHLLLFPYSASFYRYTYNQWSLSCTDIPSALLETVKSYSPCSSIFHSVINSLCTALYLRYWQFSYNSWSLYEIMLHSAY